MGHLYDALDKATQHKVVKGDTLAGIVAHYHDHDGVPDDLTWEELARFNWATSEKAEVTRALCERIGSANPNAVKDDAAPDSLVLDPEFGPSSPEPIRIPKLWKSEELELDTKYKITVRKHTKASAVGIKNLDKWFIPVAETCDIEYATLGDPACADEVNLEVYASNYCKLTDWKDGLPTFAPLDGVPVYTSKRNNGETSITDWNGVSNCAEGALSAPDHPLNVAFSPYTVTLRYSKAGKDTSARIDLDPFWVLFEQDGKPQLDTCKIKWKLKNADRLKVGLLQITDKSGAVIFAKGLNKSDLDGASFAWDGKDFAKAPITTAGMPYRVRIEAHTGIDEAEGLALAAMHTEVRLYVHKDTHLLQRPDYDAQTDQTSLDFSLADVWHKDTKLDRNVDGSLWTKYKLAQAGFHPGPVTDSADNDHFKCARNEFQRSVPKHGGTAGHYERMPIGADNKDTKDALEHLDPIRYRPWFGQPADRGTVVNSTWQPTDWDASTDDFRTRLRNPKERMIVWVDDRNWYTDGIYWKYGFYDHRILVDDHNLAAVHNDPADLGGATADGRGSFEHRDDRVDKDARDIARPWIPLQVDFRLLGKAQNLDDEVPLDEGGSKVEAVRKAIGPLRVDWTFDEIETTANVTVQRRTVRLPVLDRESEALFGMLGGSSSRTRIALRWTLDNLKSQHARKDVTKQAVYYNAKATVGGLRPDNPAAYFDTCFGKDAESLAPWTAAPSDRESLYCVVHDQIGQSNSEVHSKRFGRAGVYFHPSRIAGDGYQIRAQVFFKAADKYDFPNVATLAARYPKYPQAHTVQFRLWRKTSIRAYIKWGAADNWNNPQPRPWPNFPPPGPLGFRSYYTACHVHISNELNTPTLDHSIASVFSQQTYKTVVEDALVPSDPQDAYRNDIQFSQNRCWPWSNHDHLGFPPSPANVPLRNYFGTTIGQALIVHVRLAFRFSLEMVKSVERETGRMRGHILVEYQVTDAPWWLTYECPGCSDEYVFVQSANVHLTTLQCPRPLCGNTLTYCGPETTFSTPRADMTIQGLNTPACGFPIGVFWNFLGASELWAHELGHNRHYEHAADAFGLPDRWDYHDHQLNPAFSRSNEKPDNSCWDRSCLMSYIPKVQNQSNRPSYDTTRDKPCLCFKCALRNRGWRLRPLVNPPSDVTD